MTKIRYEHEDLNAINKMITSLISNDITKSLTIESHWDEEIGKYVLTVKEVK